MNPWNRLLIFLVSMNSLGTLYWHIVKDVSVYWQLGTGGFFLIQELVNILQSRVFSSWTPEQKPISVKSIHISAFSQKTWQHWAITLQLGQLAGHMAKSKCHPGNRFALAHISCSRSFAYHMSFIGTSDGIRDIWGGTGEPEWKIIGVSIGGNA